MHAQLQEQCRPFLDEDGRVKQFPVRGAKQTAVLGLLADKFQKETDYSEKEVNAILDRWHTFGDFYMLRRLLVDHGFLGRVPNGSRYWRAR